tara:strand:+ start:23 stop:1702 length:1680 start_codon:yes stop_codon:yes gene_type:complete
MQTPGSQTQSDTPMIPLERRMNTAYERLLRQQNENHTTAIVNKGAEARTFGRIMLQFERLNNNMEIMQSEIRRDMRARRRYFDAEKKLLKKDSDNLESIRTGALFELRRDIGVLSLALAAKDFASGNIGNALENTGVGIASFIPEIAIGVAGILGLTGGGRRVGGGRVSPGSMMGRTRGMGGKGQIFTIAALAASLLMAGQAKGDTRREQALDVQTTGVGPVVNRGDAVRFRSQLDRFDAILSRFGRSQERKQSESAIPSLPQEMGSAPTNHASHLENSGISSPSTSGAKMGGNIVQAANVQKDQAQRLQTKSSETDAISRSKQTSVPLTNLFPETDKGKKKIDTEIKSIVGSKLAEEIEQGNIMPSLMTPSVTPDNQGGEKVADMRRQSAAREALTVAPPIPQEPIIPKKSPAIEPTTGSSSAKSPAESSKSTSYEIPTPDPGIVALQKIDALGAVGNASIQPPQPERNKKRSWRDMLPPNPFARSKSKSSTGGNAPPPNVVESNAGGGGQQAPQSPPPPSKGIGPDGDPVIGTKFTRGGGAIDKFDMALSLKSYASL